jgi:chromosome partitioning protein
MSNLFSFGKLGKPVIGFIFIMGSVPPVTEDRVNLEGGIWMRRIAIALSKGGVGKTTTAVNLAAGLARSGKTVLLVDVDTQGQVARALGCEPPAGLAEFIQGEMSIEDANFLARDNLWLLSGGRSMAGLKRLITRKDFGGERTLAEAFDGLEDQYDYILMDTAPGWDALTINVLFYAQAVLTPVSLEVMTLQGLIDFSRSMTTIQRYRDDLTLKYVLPTFFDRLSTFGWRARLSETY